MKEYPMKITIKQQVSKSEETENHLTILFQDDVWVLFADIQAQRLTHNEKEKT